MENHPIPQDVTGFQFKLIGNMTIKQFAYVATGCVTAVILYYSPIFILFKILFIPLFIFAGLAFAFIPIEGRPVDVMVANFLKALFAPNQFIYQKLGQKLTIFETHVGHHAVKKPTPEKDVKQDEEREAQVQTMLQPKSHAPHIALDDKEQDFLKSLTQQNIQQHQVPSFVTIEDDTKSDALPKIQAAIDESKNPIVHYAPKEPIQADAETPAPQQPTPPTPVQQQALQQPKINPIQVQAEAKQKVAELGTQLQQVASEKAQLQTELTTLRKTLTQDNKPVFTPTTAAPQAATQHVRRIPQAMIKQAGLPNVPDAPNLVTGIVKDSSGNILPGVLVEVKDKEGNPIRAFKTNGLGQFASATSLSNGTYTIEFEDPRGKHKFDVIEISTTGAIIMPIEVISHDARETLRKELFGG